MTDWNSLLSSKKNSRVVQKFANGELSGRGLYQQFKNTELGGEVRSLLRTYCVDHSRCLARKALSRRGLVS